MRGLDRGTIVEAVMHHLARNPAAKDSARGVIHWCRAATGVAPPEALVQDILDELVRKNCIAVSVLVDGTRVYHAVPRARRGRTDFTQA